MSSMKATISNCATTSDSAKPQIVPLPQTVPPQTVPLCQTMPLPQRAPLPQTMPPPQTVLPSQTVSASTLDVLLRFWKFCLSCYQNLQQMSPVANHNQGRLHSVSIAFPTVYYFVALSISVYLNGCNTTQSLHFCFSLICLKVLLIRM